MSAEPLAHATPDQREAYARRMEQIAGNRRGSISDHIRSAAQIARGTDNSFYAGVPGTGRAW